MDTYLGPQIFPAPRPTQKGGIDENWGLRIDACQSVWFLVLHQNGMYYFQDIDWESWHIKSNCEKTQDNNRHQSNWTNKTKKRKPKFLIILPVAAWKGIIDKKISGSSDSVLRSFEKLEGRHCSVLLSSGVNVYSTISWGNRFAIMSVILATAGFDHRIRFWEAPSGICHRILKYPDSQVNKLEITPDKVRCVFVVE